MDFFSHNPQIAIELEASWRVLVAALLGLMLGLERSLAGKHAGMRTYALVAVGSCLFSVVGTIASYQLASFAAINPLQLASSVIIGIGFVGTGLSMFRDRHPVELTTAAGILVAAGIGMAAGFGFYLLGFLTTLISVALFNVFARMERAMQKRFGEGLEDTQ